MGIYKDAPPTPRESRYDSGIYKDAPPLRRYSLPFGGGFRYQVHSGIYKDAPPLRLDLDGSSGNVA